MGKVHCSNTSKSATTNANCPISGTIGLLFVDAGRHVVFVVFGEHHICVEHPISSHPAFGHASAAFLEQIRQNSLVEDADARSRVGHDESVSEPVCIVVQAALFDQSTDAEITARRRLFRGNL